MEPIARIVWTEHDTALWTRIEAHGFEPADEALTFTARLARDHGWTLATARRAVEEYRRFCFLAVAAGVVVTPSEEVGQVWHQHLTFSRDYWQVWRRHVLRQELHHQPTKGGIQEGHRFAEQYADTLARYEAWFGPPPAGFWPGTAERFGRRPALPRPRHAPHACAAPAFWPDRQLAAIPRHPRTGNPRGDFMGQSGISGWAVAAGLDRCAVPDLGHRLDRDLLRGGVSSTPPSNIDA